MNMAEAALRHLLARADIQLDGSRPWDIRVNDPRFFRTVLCRGSLGLGESYMDGWWDCEMLDSCITRMIRARLDRWGLRNPVGIGRWLKDRFVNSATRERAFLIGEEHYNHGNDLFRAMLGPTMAYTCAYWSDQDATLGAAQLAKFDLVCRKLHLFPGQTVLDVGCGFGSFARFAAEHYRVSVTGITVSEEQARFARQLCAGLPVEIRLEDYRDTARRGERFNHVVSLGMFEHVESRNYQEFFRAMNACLAPAGFFLLHTIGKHRGDGGSDPWIRKYIFPLGMIPARKQIERAAGDALPGILDWHEFGGWQYDRTLLAWQQNFAANWERELKAGYAHKLDGRFERAWRYYLLVCAGTFRAGNLDVWQVVFARGNYRYTPVR